MTSSIFGIGSSALLAAQAGLATTGHNIANVNTPGYNRQEAIQLARVPQFTGGGFMGRGVDVVAVRRVYSDFLAAQTLSTRAQSAELAAREEKLTQLDLLFGSSSVGISPALDAFFSGVNDVAAHPSSIPSRQSMLSAANALVSRFDEIDSQLTAMHAAMNSEIAGTVEAVNRTTEQIAALNKRIVDAVAMAGQDRPPNDLLDQRDQLLASLNDLVDARAVAQADGSYNVFLGGGQGLVVGQNANKLATVRSLTDASDLDVGIAFNGQVVRLGNEQLTAGSLAAAIDFRDGTLARTQNEVGRIALSLAQTFNAQHDLGQNLDGTRGGAFFTPPAIAAQPGRTNTGGATLSATLADVAAIQPSDYVLRYDGTSFSLTRLVDGNVTTFNAFPQTIDGMTLQSPGGFAAGDRFLIQPTRYAARDLAVAIVDPSDVAAATPVTTNRAQNNTGSGTISGGSIGAGYWASPLPVAGVTLTYASATGTLSGFPATQPVTVTSGSTTTTYAAGAPVPYTPGAKISFGGITISLAGQPADGDAFGIVRNQGGVGDGRNAVALAQLARGAHVAGRATFSEGLADLVTHIGTETRAASTESEAQKTLLAQAEQAQQAVSGVNLDEEAANLQRYQQAYQAAGKLMAIAATLFETILSIGA
jgi:flagellar hook-associated protein 1 FlgK